MVYDPCGCQVSGTFDDLARWHDGKACPRSRYAHLVLVEDMSQLWVPTSRCILAEPELRPRLRDPEGRAYDFGEVSIDHVTWEIASWAVHDDLVELVPLTGPPAPMTEKILEVAGSIS